MVPFEWPKGSQASSGVFIGDSGLLSRPFRKRRALSRDDRGTSWFFSNCGLILELQRGTHGSFRVAPGKFSFHSNYEGSAALLWSHGRGIGPQVTLKGESRGLSRVAAGNPGFPRLVTVTAGSFSWCLWEVRSTLEFEKSSRVSTGIGAMEEGLISN